MGEGARGLGRSSPHSPASRYNILMPTADPLSLSYALAQDAQDELAAFRAEFAPLEPGLLYLDGNSLGRMPIRAIQQVRNALVDEWGTQLVRAWGTDWWDAPRRVGEALAPLLGAAPNQVRVADSTSINLYKLADAACAAQATASRRVLLTDALNFPSDLYILQGIAQARDLELRLLPDDSTDPTQTILDALTPEVCLVSLSLVTFKSGYLYDAAAITARAHAVGALVLWDVCHAVGAVDIQLDAWQADLAVGCTYKYLNAGPGAPAFLYVRADLQSRLTSPIQGWWGTSAPFAFDLTYTPAEGINRFLVGSAPILSIKPLEASLEIFQRAGMPRILRKSAAQTAYLIALIDHFLAPLGVEVVTPRSPQRRGSHVSIRHPQAYPLSQALIAEMNLLPDFREPDQIRLAVTPLYTSYADLFEAVQRIAQALRENRAQNYSAERKSIT